MSLKEQLKILQGKKQYEAMIALLEASDEPNKATIIARIKLRMKEEVKAAAAVKPAPVEPVAKVKPLPGTPGYTEKAKPAERSSQATVIFACVLIGLVGVLAFAFVQNQRSNSIYSAMYGVCHDVYREDYYDGTFTVNQITQGCLVVARETIDRYGKEVNYCYDNENQTDARFMQCLADNEVKMYSTALYDAPED